MTANHLAAQDPSRRPRRNPWIVPMAVALLTLLFACLTGPRVFRAPLWGDELRTWRDGVEPPLATVLLWRHNQDHAPLGHLLARGGAALFGVDQPWALRLGAWLCGLACVPALWRLGRSLDDDVRTGDAVGLLMAAMLVVDANVGFQVTQARMYPPMLLAAIVALTAAVRLLRARSDVPIAGDAITLAAALAVGLWSHSQMWAVIAPTLLVALVVTASRTSRVGRPGRGPSAAIVAVLVALVVGAQGVAKLVGQRGAASVADEGAEPPLAQLEDAVGALTGGDAMTLLVAAGAIAGLIVVGRRHRAAAWLLGGVIAMAVVNLLIAARYRPVGFARYLTVAQPALWALVAALVVELATWARRDLSLARSRLAVGALAIAFAAACGVRLAGLLAALPPHPIATPFRDAVRDLPPPRAGERVVMLPRLPYASFARYYGVRNDDAAYAAVTSLIKRRRPDATTAPSSRVRLPTTAAAAAAPLTIVGVIPARGNKAGTADDPLVFARALAAARGVRLPPIPTPDGTLRVIVIRFDGNGVKVIDERAPHP